MIISELLDNPDETGIYLMTKCFEQLDELYDKIASELAKGKIGYEIFNKIEDLRNFLLHHADQEMIRASCLHYLGDSITEGQGIKAKALRKKGTDKWYCVGTEKHHWFEDDLPELYPIDLKDWIDVDTPEDAELIDITIVINEPKGGKP